MSDIESQKSVPMQFETAEFSTQQTTLSVCQACKTPITQAYYMVNDAIVCDQCRRKINAFTEGGTKIGRAIAAAILGLLAGLAGAALWYGVRIATGYEIGLIAIVVGLMVGIAVRKGARGRGGWFYQLLAILLTYCCISAQYVPDIIVAINNKAQSQQSEMEQTIDEGQTDVIDDNQPDHPVKVSDTSEADETVKIAETKVIPPSDVPADEIDLFKGGLYYALFIAIVFIMSLTLPVVSGFESPIGLLIVGFALYEAWKINKRSVVQITGPFELGPQVATGAPSV